MIMKSYSTSLIGIVKLPRKKPIYERKMLLLLYLESKYCNIKKNATILYKRGLCLTLFS